MSHHAFKHTILCESTGQTKNGHYARLPYPPELLGPRHPHHRFTAVLTDTWSICHCKAFLRGSQCRKLLTEAVSRL